MIFHPGLLKKILKRRRDLKLIISSATVDAEYIRDFFNRGVRKAGGGGKSNKRDGNSGGGGSATILSVEGRNYSVDILYQDSPCADYVKQCAAVAQRIHEQEPPGDILIFLTGMEEVDRCCDLLKVSKPKRGSCRVPAPVCRNSI